MFEPKWGTMSRAWQQIHQKRQQLEEEYKQKLSKLNDEYADTRGGVTGTRRRGYSFEM